MAKGYRPLNHVDHWSAAPQVKVAAWQRAYDDAEHFDMGEALEACLTYDANGKPCDPDDAAIDMVVTRGE